MGIAEGSQAVESDTATSGDRTAERIDTRIEELRRNFDALVAARNQHQQALSNINADLLRTEGALTALTLLRDASSEQE